ncbi:Mobile element protein (plasmid) [Rhodovulum sp. P5]|nr:Mobile element protein [Rhodovulum sp. P5]
MTGTPRAQSLLLPERVEDYVGANNPVRFIDAFVAGLDLAAAGFARAKPKSTGRPGYDPADLLKLYIYGYLNRVRSSRRLQAETHRNLEVIWLMRHLKPDFKTIADFRKDNRLAFREIFRQFVRLCRDLDLFGRELLAVDGTRIKAVNNSGKNFTKASLKRDLALIDKRLDHYLSALNNADAEDDNRASDMVKNDIRQKIEAMKARRERLIGHQEELEETGADQLSLTDPDARAMDRNTRVGVGYNIQIAVDVKHKLIAEQQVHSKVSDLGLLAKTAISARKLLGVERIDVVADKGYFAIEDIAASEAGNAFPIIPRPRRGAAASKGLFVKERFQYDGTADHYTCPGGQNLPPNGKKQYVRDGVFEQKYRNYRACKQCRLKPRRTGSEARTVSRYENEEVLERMAERLVARPEVLGQRRETVEHPFGSIKQWMGQGAFLTRRLENVRGEFSLTALAYNIRRAITLVGVPTLIQAART